ncbi:MAG: carboxypeptidase M32 [Christensenellales bacterium]|jgi:carboxypeptidase Taq
MDQAKKETFKGYQKKMQAYGHALGLMNYDAQTAAPKGNTRTLGETIGVLSEEMYKLSSSDELYDLAQEVLADPAMDMQTRREAEEIKRDIDETRKIPMDEYVAFQMLLNESGNVWAKAKTANDFASFAPYLEKVIGTVKRMAGYVQPETPVYDYLLDRFERGLTAAQCDAYFATLRKTLVPLIREVSKAKRAIQEDYLTAAYPIHLQQRFSKVLMDLLTIDPRYCSITETEHPFTTSFSKYDVRITTHYHENDFVSNMYSVIHEGGHALYELHTGDELIGSVLAGGTSMGIHESQSRFFENIIGRSREFCGVLLPRMKEIFPGQLRGVTEEDLYLGVNRAQCSLIRTDADELTYSMHIMIRYELERQIMAGDLKVAELPSAWNAAYKETLGVDVPDDTRGVLQDTHWSGGMFGYFPSYSIGSAYGCQMLASMEKDLPVFRMVEENNLAPIVEWLAQRIYRYGRMLHPDQVMENCCGAAFEPAFYTDYLTRKFTEIYKL